jgi:hypothetical protein
MAAMNVIAVSAPTAEYYTPVQIQPPAPPAEFFEKMNTPCFEYDSTTDCLSEVIHFSKPVNVSTFSTSIPKAHKPSKKAHKVSRVVAEIEESNDDACSSSSEVLSINLSSIRKNDSFVETVDSCVDCKESLTDIEQTTFLELHSKAGESSHYKPLCTSCIKERRAQKQLRRQKQKDSYETVACATRGCTNTIPAHVFAYACLKHEREFLPKCKACLDTHYKVKKHVRSVTKQSHK